MSDAAESDAPEAPDADAWATACEEDLAAERARRRAEHGQQPGNAADELRRLADAVSEKVAELGRPFGGTMASAAAQGMAQQLIAQAKAAAEPVLERNPQVFDHLAAAGGELLAAYRAAVQEAEGRWTAGAGSTRTSGDSGPSGAGTGEPAADDGGTTSGGSRLSAGIERIDLDKDPAETGRPGETEDSRPAGEADGTASPGRTGDSGETGETGGTGETGPGDADGPDRPSPGSEGPGGR